LQKADLQILNRFSIFNAESGFNFIYNMHLILFDLIFTKINMISLLVYTILLAGAFYLIWHAIKGSNSRGRRIVPADEIERILKEEVDFFTDINNIEHKESFKRRVIHFIERVRFTSVGGAEHSLKDEVLIASSAIIPIFNFPDWEYPNLKEVLLYEDHFDHTFKVDSDKNIMGMVGDGALNNTMLLSLRALREGFEKRDGNHTAIHEFIHLIDKADGVIDGIPEHLIPKELIHPWLRLIRHSINEVRTQETGIDPYAGTNEAEFFAVISEYFFEKPNYLARHHPELFQLLKKAFKPTVNS
jgi:Mlc titration factor MtfA (ptsG expression regulator)